jgi:hypothetical protein
LHENDLFKFYLTGSRFFRTNITFSDWDFFAQDSKIMRSFLESIGFEKITDVEEYKDRQTEIVYRINENTSNQVDVQLVRVVAIKMIAQELMINRINFNTNVNYGTSTKNIMWNLEYNRAKNLLLKLQLV